ncbi:hypothetical protein [Mycolicibacterium fortuitum]|uniref:hypothetical protein n=1 Tax=Mycolicibacterium fortuitum TaxID=1766 RepID=UPI0006CAC1A9|nr:hypothetical protein [Mycolicibacterium fortuitum]OBB40968.1 hypothetical protein A5754_18270 [Mycolicibacterium fortuitum]OBB51745.1 hypothetical protein A5755_04085 [Mycolicibacterium fortuitum]OBF74177.1 hypothetical protein A5751_28020 [Mycolicibacterium fortuitum]
MRTGDLTTAKAVRSAIQAHGPSIYDEPATELTGDFYTPSELEALLHAELVGRPDLGNLPVRTRSKVAKTLVCQALGYVAPASFQKVNPRLRHANVDVYSQQSTNLQIWNQEVDSARRYVVLIIKDDVITDVKVIAGADLAQFDTTGTLTSKFQANRINDRAGSMLVSAVDTPAFVTRFAPSSSIPQGVSPVVPPTQGKVLDIAAVYHRLLPLIGRSYSDPGQTQERNRGSVVHKEACSALGLSHYADHGQFPDILSQLLEVKLQLARTIDLGLELPESPTPLASANGVVSVRDVRYAIFYGTRTGPSFQLTDLVVVTGHDFFKEFRQFAGKVSNSKLQLRLDAAWFT